LFCCNRCFGNNKYVDELIEFTKAEKGTCGYCGTELSSIIEPSKLRDRFEFLCSIYVESNDSDAKSIIDYLVDDWEIFKNQDKLKSAQLLGHILDDKSVAGKSFIPIALEDTTPKEMWIKFCGDLVNKYRFFPDHKPDDKLPELFAYLLELLDGHVYRARIESNAPFKKNEMGMPPAKLSRGGRANPVGIPYLYAASNLDTAIAETRPHPGNCVSVAKFKVIEELKVVNLISPRGMISPFDTVDEDYLLQLRYDVEFLCHLGEVLSKPVVPDTAEMEYLPTQYLCESIKKASYDGVMFKSSVGNGVNYALFGDSKLKPISVSSHKIKRLDYTSEQKKALSSVK